MRAVLDDFLSRTGISVRAPALENKSKLGRRVRDVTAGWNLGDSTPKGFDIALSGAIWMAGCAYSHVEFDAQVHIALYTLLAICIDDLDVPHIAMEEFMERFYLNSPQLHPILDLFVDNIRNMNKYFLAFPTKLIIKSTIDAVNMMAFDKETESMALRPQALSYVTLKRLYNGAADAYFCFIFDKFTFPDVTVYIQALP